MTTDTRNCRIIIELLRERQSHDLGEARRRTDNYAETSVRNVPNQVRAKLGTLCDKRFRHSLLPYFNIFWHLSARYTPYQRLFLETRLT